MLIGKEKIAVTLLTTFVKKNYVKLAITISLMPKLHNDIKHYKCRIIRNIHCKK